MKKIIYKSNNVIRCMLTIPEEFNGSESELMYDVLKAVEDNSYGSSCIEQIVIDEDLLFLINQSKNM